MANSKASNRKTQIDLMRNTERERKKLYGLQRQKQSGISASTITSNVGSGGSSDSGGGIFGDNLGNHTAQQVLKMSMFQVKQVATPTECNDAVTKCYVDDAIALLAAINGLQGGGGISNGIIEVAEITLISTPFYDFANINFIVENVGIILDDTPFFSGEGSESISESVSVVELEP